MKVKGKYRHFAMWLQNAIESQDLNRSKAAILSDVSRHSIGDYVMGCYIPTLESVYLICRGMNLSLSEAINECIKDLREDLK